MPDMPVKPIFSSTGGHVNKTLKKEIDAAHLLLVESPDFLNR